MASDKKKNTRFPYGVLFGLASIALAGGAQGLVPMNDDDLGEISGQALFVADFITGAANSGLNFYRMGLDAEIALNMNIDKFALGCGGVNDRLGGDAVCDIDMDFVRLMGLGPGQTSPDGRFIPNAAPAPDANNPLSDFILTRPYISLAIKNDDSNTLREVVGVKIGSQEAHGYFGVGRVLGRIPPVDPPHDPPSGRDIPIEDYHVGLNSFSGFLNIEETIIMRATLRGSFSSSTSDLCSGNVPCSDTGPVFRQVYGTRITDVHLPGLPLTPNGGLADFLGDEVYADIYQDLRTIHGFSLVNTGDFFLSFQRERVAWPKYDKSGFAQTANTGWWMNVPYVGLDLRPPSMEMDCGFAYTACLEAFSAPGIPIRDIEMDSSPPDNCYGNSVFC